MNLEIRYANHPEDSKHYTTEELRRHYLIEKLFLENEARLVYSHIDRIVAGGIMPAGKKITLDAGKELGVSHFFQRREAGIINIGGKGKVTIDGNVYALDNDDGLYIGMGSREVAFESENVESPAKFYFNSSPAHKAFTTRVITLEEAKKVKLGEKENVNARTINQYIHPDVCDSCQLVMGMTILEPGSVWNTMPAHTHERRMEVYMYFNMSNDTRVFHFMGQPQETRHIALANEQAVISPSWSIHSGVGTSNYTFIWGMCGENIEFTDMDHIAIKDIR